MAADSSFTQMLFFIAAIVVAVSVSGVIIGISNSMVQELKVKTDSLKTEIGTDIEIVNDPRQVPYADGNLTIYLKNVGDISLKYNNIAILIDGQYVNETSVVNEFSGGMWPVGKTVEMKVKVLLSTGDHEIKAIMPNGVYDTMAFRT